VVNEFLGYVADRGYSPRTEWAYAFDLLAFARWLVDQDLTVGGVTTDALLRFLTFCRAAVLPGAGRWERGAVADRGRSTGYAQATINRRMAAISGLFDFRANGDTLSVGDIATGAHRVRVLRAEDPQLVRQQLLERRGRTGRVPGLAQLVRQQLPQRRGRTGRVPGLAPPDGQVLAGLRTGGVAGEIAGVEVTGLGGPGVPQTRAASRSGGTKFVPALSPGPSGCCEWSQDRSFGRSSGSRR
jgi:integrase